MIGADNGFFPGRRPAIFWTNAEMLFIRTLGTNFSEILRCSYVFIQENSIQIVVYKMAAIFSQSQCIKELTKFLKTRSYISFIISHLLWYMCTLKISICQHGTNSCTIWCVILIWKIGVIVRQLNIIGQVIVCYGYVMQHSTAHNDPARCCWLQAHFVMDAIESLLHNAKYLLHFHSGPA